MAELYRSLKNELRSTLDRFRFGELASGLLSGVITLALFFLFYVLSYYLIVSCFNISITFKTALYFIFLIGLGLLFCYGIMYPFVLFILSLNLRNNRLERIVLRYLAQDKDVFVSLYSLAFNFDGISGDEELKRAAFVQKYNVRKNHYGPLTFPYKRLLWKTLLAGLLLSVFIFNGGGVNRLYADMAAYEEVSNPRFNVNFDILNESLNVEYGKPFKLKLKVETDYLAIDNVFICFGGGEFLMNKQDSLFAYDFDVINNDIKFYFKASGVESKSFKINVLPIPEITDYQVVSIPPAYTGLKQEVLKNVVDFRVLYGTALKFEIDFAELDSLFLKWGDKEEQLILKSDSKIDFSKIIRSSGELSLYGSNRNFIRKNLIDFSVTCIPDLYPGIQVTAVQDSLNTSYYYFFGIMNDDFGFSELRFCYTLNGQSPVIVPVDIIKNINTQEFYFNFDFAEFAGMDKAKVNYYFEVFDNDNLSGPKSTRSDAKEYLVPDLDAIFDYNQQADNQVNHSLKEAEKLAKEVVSGVKDLQKKLLDNTVDNWEKQQLSKDIVEKKNKFDKLLNIVKEENVKKDMLNKSFTKQDSTLIEKQQMIQDLLNNIMDDEMKKLIDEFSKLSEEFSKDKFKELDEKMKLGFDQLSEELDRNIELLKRFQTEERHDIISKQFDKLRENQEKFSDALKEKSMTADSLKDQAADLKKELDNVKNNYDDLLKENSALEEPYKLQDFKKEFEELSQTLDKQDKETAEGKKDKDTQKDAKKEMDELSEKMEQQQQQNFMEMALPKNDIELIIQNILIISLSQEELLDEFPNVSPLSARYNELGRLQDMKKLQYKIVKDSLSVLAKSNLMLASILSDKFYDIEVKFGLLPGYIQDIKRNELKKEQMFIVNYLNDMALSLADALQKDKSGSKGSSESTGKKGSKQGNGKGSGKEQGYDQMKQFQQGIKKQMEDLVSKMKNGEKGKPLQQGMSRMIRQNELFKKSLSDFISETGSLSNSEKQLLNEINKLLDENIQDIANYSISGNLIQRNNQIYSKLLMSEKASKEREEYDEKRKSTTAGESRFEPPAALLDMKRKSSLMKMDMHKSDVQLNSFFKNMFNNYYIRLGNE